jgi:NAD(P)-dependent dehydrogenase (short-subunit alcohol dehydrogenase family)
MSGKVAVITGASRGIGAGLVAGYRGQGWAVAASARTIAQSQDPDLLTLAGNLSDPADANRIIGATLNRFGRIDTLVNNAGIYLSRPFTDYTPADYAAVTAVNLAGFFWIAQRAIGEMATRYGGHVVNVLATTADLADLGTPAVLTALTNGGQAAATRSLALEYASRGIRVNAVTASFIQPRVHQAWRYDGLRDQIPFPGHVGQVSDVVNAVLFLEYSPAMTGEILHINGASLAE